MKQLADALKDSPFEEDRAAADYLKSKLEDMEDGIYHNTWNLADPDKPLTETEKRVLIMRFFRGMTVKEVAKRTGHDYQYVMNVVSKASKKYSIPQQEFWESGGRLR